MDFDRGRGDIRVRGLFPLEKGRAQTSCPYDKMNSTFACGMTNVFHEEKDVFCFFFLNPIMRENYKDANAL